MILDLVCFFMMFTLIRALSNYTFSHSTPRFLLFLSGLWVQIPLIGPSTGSVFIHSWVCTNFQKNSGFVFAVTKPGSRPSSLLSNDSQPSC